jgi:beta-N-acetylhexosaminidase
MRKVRLPLGPAVIDVVGLALSDDDRKRLVHPAAGGAIFFSRNFQSPEQLRVLTEEVERLREPALPICVDHEGGRVQRFREGFTPIPPMRQLGRLWDRDREAGRTAARAAAYVIGAELAAHGVDFSFAPVLDLDYGSSSVIGDRALHFDPTAVGALGASIVQGFADAGMASVGKHFPGHGFAEADSHVDVPRDARGMKELLKKDLLPFDAVIKAGVAAIMPAHVIYSEIDPEPAGYSKYWLQQVLRGQLCNDPEGQERLLESLGDAALARPDRLEKMRKKGGRDLRKSVAYREAQETLQKLA